MILKSWERGAEVYKNVGCSGKTDLVLSYGGNVLEVDVKQMNKNGEGKYTASGSASRASKSVVLVNPETLEVRWIKGKEPKGWENFWD